jgi:hypothetical protein
VVPVCRSLLSFTEAWDDLRQAIIADSWGRVAQCLQLHWGVKQPC